MLDIGSGAVRRRESEIGFRHLISPTVRYFLQDLEEQKTVLSYGTRTRTRTGTRMVRVPGQDSRTSTSTRTSSRARLIAGTH